MYLKDPVRYARGGRILFCLPAQQSHVGGRHFSDFPVFVCPGSMSAKAIP
jgi:hypothetical protein